MLIGTVIIAGWLLACAGAAVAFNKSGRLTMTSNYVQIDRELLEDIMGEFQRGLATLRVHNPTSSKVEQWEVYIDLIDEILKPEVPLGEIKVEKVTQQEFAASLNHAHNPLRARFAK